MKQSKLISIMLSVALLGAMLNFPVLAEEQSADAAARIVYDQNFDACTWWEGGTPPTAEEFTEVIFYNNAQNVAKVQELQAGMYGRADTDKSLHLGTTFQHGYRWEDDGEHKIMYGAKEGTGTDKFWPVEWGGEDDMRGNNGVSHRLSLNAPEMSADEGYMHVSFSAAQTPMPNFKIAGDNGAGLDVAFDYITDNGDVTDKEVLRWCGNENRQQAAFGTVYEVGVPDTAPMTAGNWINYDYVFHTTAKTVDVYLNGYPVIKGKDISGEVNHATIKGLRKLNFQVRDINIEGNQRKVDVYVDDIKVAYSAAEPVVSPQSVFGEKANINASEKYVNNEAGIIYNYGQSLDDMKKYLPDKQVSLVAVKWGQEANYWWTEYTDSLGDSRPLNDGTIVNPVLCAEDGNFFYCYEVKQPQATNINATIGGNTLTWSGNSADCQGIEIFRNGEKIASLDGSATEYAGIDKAEYTIRELLPGGNVSVFVAPSSVDGTRTIYAENFDDKTWWEGENAAPSEDKFKRTPFFSYLDDNDGQNMESIYQLETGANGRAANDKSLHINEKFKLGYAQKPDGSDAADATEDGLWVGTWDGKSVGNNGVSHRMASNSETMREEERYLHISFSAVQDPMPQESIAGEHGAGLDVSFHFMTNSGNSDKEMLHWYGGRQQGVFGTFYEVRTDVGKWVNYDYVFDKTGATMNIYVNGYPMVQGKDISNEISQITGLNQLNFQVRDMNTGDSVRDIHVYLDDIKVAYSKEMPAVSPYFSFGDAAYISAPEKYVNNEAGIIYNYGQGLSGMKQYFQNKKVYLVKEKADSTLTHISLEEYSSNSLDAVILNDGRTVSPILYVEDGEFTYCYKIKQTKATSINLVVADIAQDSITLSWDGKSDTCKAIEIFRDGAKIAALDGGAQSYTDKDVVLGQRYEYCIREIVADDNATKFSETRSSFISSVGRPENFAAVLNTNQLAVKLTWAAPRYGTVTGYEIYRDGALLTTVSAGVCEYTDSSDLTVGRAYRYCVAAVGEGTAKSDKTPEIQIVADVISPPQNVKVENADGNVKISWDGVAGAKGYEVYRNGVRVAQTADFSYILTDCADDSFYEFFVKSVNEAGQASRASETANYIKHGTKFDVFCDVFGDTLGDGFSYTTTNGAVIESGLEYCVIGTSGIRIGFNSQHFDGQAAGFSVNGGLDFSKIKNSAAEIRFMIYVPEGMDTGKLRFGVAQNYNSSLAGGAVKLKADVALNQYVKATGWNLVRIPLKDLPEKGTYTATSANLPYETKFDYSKAAELGFFSSMEGIADTIYFMVDEIAVYANEAPRVTSVKAGGKEIANGDVISGQTDRFSVTFDAELDGGQLSSNEMKVVRGNKKVPSVVEYDEQTGEYAICLLDHLEADQAYSVVIQNTVSKGGMIQNQKYTISFTTDAVVTTEPITKTVEMNLQSMSGTTSAPMVQRLDFTGGAANEAVCGFDIEISYGSDKLFLNKDEVTLASGLKNSGIVVGNADGKLKVSRAVDKSKTMSLQDGIGTFGIRALESGSTQISAAGTLYCYYPDTDAVKEFAVNGSAAISAVKGPGGSGSSGGSGGGKGSSSIGGARPSVGGSDPVIPPPVKTTFSDISSVEWAREGILYLSENNIINGYEDNTFRPNRAITREEFVAIIVRAFALEDETADSSFADVNQSDWYYSYVSSAVNAGIIKGIADDTFGAGETISRQDMCTIMSRVIESTNLVIDKKYSKLEFSDGNDIADYAKQAVTELQQMGVINGIGDNLFAPGGEVTRAMAAKAVYQMIQGRNR